MGTRHLGADNVVSMVLHHDETTPHLSAFVVPVDPVTHRLNASRWLDGRKCLSLLQDTYAAAVAAHGLKRGIAGSLAKHTTIRQFYAAIQRDDVGTIQVPSVEKPPLFDREAWQEDETKRLRDAVAPQADTLKEQARVGLMTARRVKELQASMQAMRAITDRVRALPLAEVAKLLGLHRHKADEKQWCDLEGRFRITLDGRKFMDHTVGKGGGGAIDLVMHVLDRDYQGAVSWLADVVGADRAAQDVAATAISKAKAIVQGAQKSQQPFALPSAPDRELIQSYLVGTRGLDPALIDRLIADGQIVSDTRKNVGFVMMDEAGSPRGLELHGTDPARPFAGLALGSSRDATFRVLVDPGRTGQPPRVIITESAIDALSYLRVSGDDGRGPVLVASTAGARSTLPSSLTKAVEAAPAVGIGFNNDPISDSAATRLIAALQRWYRNAIRRLRPMGTDWNAHLEHQRAGTTPPRSRPIKPMPPPVIGVGIE